MGRHQEQPWTCETTAVELCHRDKLIGYAIFFSGYWDAYIFSRYPCLLSVGTGYETRDDAIRAVNEQRDWRT
jgi:hypothetical protein